MSVLFGDERCFAPDDPESNCGMAKSELLDRVFPGSVHRMAGELGAGRGPRSTTPDRARLSPLDLVLLGIGPDGHTASLFPGRGDLLAAPGHAIAVHEAPKPPPDRVSLTLGALREARRVVFLVTGRDKAEAVELAHRGEVPAGMIPGAEYLADRPPSASLDCLEQPGQPAFSH